MSIATFFQAAAVGASVGAISLIPLIPTYLANRSEIKRIDRKLARSFDK